MANLLADLQVAWRSLRRSPGLVAIATLSLSLGIAVNVVIFTGVDVLIRQPLAYPEPDRLVQVWSANPARGWDESSVSMADFVDWREQASGVQLTMYGGGAFNLAEGERPERVGGLRVTAEFFDVLGVVPFIGRAFRPNEETPGQGAVVVLGHGIWTRRFGADSAVVGRAIRLDGAPYSVIGVLPESFSFGFGNEIYTPIGVTREEDRRNRSYEVIGRLSPNVAAAQAERELDAIAARLAAAHPVANDGMQTRVVSLLSETVGEETSQAGTISLVAVLFVLLIACANVANLLLARGAVRERELAVRASLGATRGRLLRQLLVEGVLLSVAGGVLGLGLSFVGTQWLLTLIPPDAPRIEDVRVGGRALAYGMVITLASGIGFSLAPALQSTSGNLVGPLHDGGRGASVSRSAGRLRSGFVIGELGLALVLLISAGLLIKAAIQMQQQPLGFETAGTLTFRVNLPAQEYPDGPAVNGVFDRLVSRLEAQPSVTSVGLVTRLPMRGGAGTYYQVEGEEVHENQRPVAQFRYASPGYLPTMGIALSSGRWIDDTDLAGAPPVVVVNEAFARRHFDAGALGRRLIFSTGPHEIVGVVANVPEFGREDAPPALFYFALAQRASPAGYSVVVKGREDGGELGPLVRQALREVAPTIPTYDMISLEGLVAAEERDKLIMPKLLTMFGVIALVLAVVGVYGVMAYVVSTRSAEMGIRRALGAETGHIVGLVLRHSGRLAAIGAVIGVGLAAVSARGLSSFLLGVSPFDPVIFASVTLLLVIAALAASALPARRATSVAPTEALKAD